MIVRDEEKVLGRCLSSLAPYVDELCIVDTGSKDRTVETAESFGARVAHFQWCDDFAAARNESLKFATCDWILVVDADEWLFEPNAKLLKQFIAGTADVLDFKIHEYYDDGKEDEQYITRLFRNHLGIRYERRIHERPVIDGLRRELIDGPVLLHDGYLTENVRRKGDRNIRLLEKALLENPHDLELRQRLEGERRFLPR